jgi:hypothetical protein
MTLTRGAQRAIIAAFCVAILVIYIVAWKTPAIGLSYDDGVHLVTAESLATGHGYSIQSLPSPIPQTKVPPLFPAALALFTMVSRNAQWLKLAPALAALGWLALTHRLLRRMGAGSGGAWLVTLISAAAPMTVFLGTNLLPETSLALLISASLLMVLEDRPLIAGIFAGLATVTHIAGLALIVAGMIVLLAHRRARAAGFFTAAAMIFVAPWIGWSLAHHSAGDPATNIVTGLRASEKAVVLGANVISLFKSPFALLSGIANLYAAFAAALIFGWSVYRRRQLLPDLFVILYCLALLIRVEPPVRLMGAILPLALWIVWRAVREVKIREATAAATLLIALTAVWADARRLPVAWREGVFTASDRAPDDWRELEKAFAYIRTQTPPDAVVIANLDPMFCLNTGRKATRGFVPDGYRLYYAPKNSLVTPDRLTHDMNENGVSYVALTPDTGLPESTAYRRSVEALERGGMIEPIPIPGLAAEYQLFRITGATVR